MLLGLPGVRHAFTTRVGGRGRGAYAGFNLGLHATDDPEGVIQDRRLACRFLGRSLGDWVSTEQVHGCKVVQIGADARGRGAADHRRALPGADGMACRDSGPVLAVFAADCATILIADRQGPAAAAVHAGWRGTAAGIAAEAVDALIALGSPPSRLAAAIGPAIGPCCYAVGDDVAQALAARYGDEVIQSRSGRAYADLAMCNRKALARRGVPAEWIAAAPWCTRCRTDLFYSHRAAGGRTGRHAALISRHFHDDGHRQERPSVGP